MAETMRALMYDRAQDPWESSRGLRIAEVPRATLDERADYHDRSEVLIRPKLMGFCGSDHGIWFQRAFKNMIFGSLDREAKHRRVRRDQRIIGHELLGEVVAVGSDARCSYGLEVGDTVSAESHIYCGVCH